MADDPDGVGGLREAAAAIARTELGARDPGVSRLAGGAMTFNFVVRLSSSERFVTRFYPEGRADVLAYEPDLLERLREAGVAVPQVVLDSRSGPPAPRPYLVYRWIPGTPLSGAFDRMTRQERRLVASQLVAALHRVHSVRIEGYGELSDARHAGHRSWRSFLEDSVRDGLDAVRRHALVDRELLAQLEAMTEHVAGLESGEPASGLVWCDMSMENVLIDGEGGIAGLLDFENALAGDAQLDLGYCYARYRGTPFYESLAEAWTAAGGVADRHRIALYAVLRALRLWPFAGEPLPTGGARVPIPQLLPGVLPALGELAGRDRDGIR